MHEPGGQARTRARAERQVQERSFAGPDPAGVVPGPERTHDAADPRARPAGQEPAPPGCRMRGHAGHQPGQRGRVDEPDLVDGVQAAVRARDGPRGIQDVQRQRRERVGILPWRGRGRCRRHECRGGEDGREQGSHAQPFRSGGAAAVHGRIALGWTQRGSVAWRRRGVQLTRLRDDDRRGASIPRPPDRGAPGARGEDRRRARDRRRLLRGDAAEHEAPRRRGDRAAAHRLHRRGPRRDGGGRADRVQPPGSGATGCTPG